MDTENGVIAAIRRVQIKARMLDVSRAALAREAGVGYKTLEGYKDEAWRPTTTVLEKVEAALERLAK